MIRKYICKECSDSFILNFVLFEYFNGLGLWVLVWLVARVGRGWARGGGSPP